MSHPAHPQARLSDARENCAQIPVLLHILLAIVATLLGRPRALTRAWQGLPLPAAEHPHCDLFDDEGPYDYEYGIPYDGTHMTIEHPILYVIGPGPNRGLRPHPRKTPVARPRIARAPPPLPATIRPAPIGAEFSPAQPGRRLTPILLRYRNILHCNTGAATRTGVTAG
jgi:hypothetical protein